MKGKGSNKLTGVFRRTGRILGTITCSLMICLSVFTAIYNLVNGTDTIPLYITAFVIIILTLCIVLVWREDIAGAILLIIASGGAPFYIQVIDTNYKAWLFLGTPFVISAIFLFTAGILSIGNKEGKFIAKGEISKEELDEIKRNLE
jgi:hypothetical protein